MLASNDFDDLIFDLVCLWCNFEFHPLTFGSYYLCTCFSSHARLLMDLSELMFKLPYEAKLKEKNNLMDYALNAL